MSGENGAGGERPSGRSFPDWYRDVARLHAEGLHDGEIAARLGRPVSSIHTARRRLHVRAHVGARVTHHEIQRIRALAAEGVWPSEIARRLGRSNNTILTIGRREGITFVVGPNRRQEYSARGRTYDPKVISAIRKATTKAEAARLADVSVETIDKALASGGYSLGLSPGIVLERTTGDDAHRDEWIRTAFVFDPHELLEDHGREQIEAWIARTDEDIAALRRLRRALDAALLYADARQSPSESVARGK